MHTESGLVTSRTKDFSTILQLLYVLLGFSVVVSLFGMVNTLVLSVFERTRELGMLRAVGMTRRQARQMIRHESVITALIGAVLGLPLGIFLAALVAQALSQYGVSFSLPVGTLAVFAARGDPGGRAGGRPSRQAGIAPERAQGAAVRVEVKRGVRRRRSRTPRASPTYRRAD